MSSADVVRLRCILKKSMSWLLKAMIITKLLLRGRAEPPLSDVILNRD